MKKRRLRLEISFKEATPMINYPNILKKAFGYHILNAERGAQIHARSQAEFYTEPKITLWKTAQDNTLHEQSGPACGTAVAVSLWSNGGNRISLRSATRKALPVGFWRNSTPIYFSESPQAAVGWIYITGGIGLLFTNPERCPRRGDLLQQHKGRTWLQPIVSERIVWSGELTLSGSRHTKRARRAWVPGTCGNGWPIGTCRPSYSDCGSRLRGVQ